MAKLNDETHVLMDGAVKVYLRDNTKRWQALFQIGGIWVLISIGIHRSPAFVLLC